MNAYKTLLFAPLLMASSAAAQEPTAPAPAATAATVSDDEVARFAQAALAVERIAAIGALDEEDKKMAMAEAVRGAGFTPKRFNEIALASQSDAALEDRIVAAAQSAQPVAPSR